MRVRVSSLDVPEFFYISRFASFMSDGVDITPEEKKEYDEASFDYANYLTSDEDSKLDGSLTGEL